MDDVMQNNVKHKIVCSVLHDQMYIYVFHEEYYVCCQSMLKDTELNL